MNRCFLFLSLVGFSFVAQAQLSEPLPVTQSGVLQSGTPGLRKFPEKALRGTMKIVLAPEILLDGKRERLSPGARIRDTSHRLVMSASITGQEFVVNFVRNGTEIHEVWILTELEARQKIKTNTPATNFTFASDANASKSDDGKTPFNQLPSFEQQGRQQRTP